jgi:heptosyltransferase III
MTPPRSVLVVITRRIGDVLLATPLIRSVKEAWPQTSIDALVFAGTDVILDGNPDLARVITVGERPAPGEHLALLARLWRRYDMALSLVPSDRPTLYAWLAGRFSAGLVAEEAKHWWKRLLLSRSIRFEPLHVHTLATHLALADELGIGRCYQTMVQWDGADEAAVRAMLPFDADRIPYAVLHGCPKFNYKMWSRDGWVTLARHLVARGLRVIWSGSNAPEELAYVASIAERLPANTVNVAGKVSLRALAFLLARASLYVGPDTVVTHMAAGLGTPTVALYGPTNPVKWGPWPCTYSGTESPWRPHGTQSAGNVRLVQGTGHCVPCLHEGCRRRIDSFSDCLQTLPVARVIAAVNDLLNGTTAHDGT